MDVDRVQTFDENDLWKGRILTLTEKSVGVFLFI